MQSSAAHVTATFPTFPLASTDPLNSRSRDCPSMHGCELPAGVDTVKPFKSSVTSLAETTIARAFAAGAVTFAVQSMNSTER